METGARRCQIMWSEGKIYPNACGVIKIYQCINILGYFFLVFRRGKHLNDLRIKCNFLQISINREDKDIIRIYSKSKIYTITNGHTHSFTHIQTLLQTHTHTHTHTHRHTHILYILTRPTVYLLKEFTEESALFVYLFVCLYFIVYQLLYVFNTKYWLIGCLVLWYINLCRLFNPKRIFIQKISSI